MRSSPDVAGYFFDNNVSRHLAAGMKAFGEAVFHMTDLWPDKDPGDEVWIPEIGRRGLILITFDARIGHKPAQLTALRENKVGGFFLGARRAFGGPSRCDMIEQVVRHWRLIKRTANESERPFLFHVRRFGTKLTPLHRGRA